jgi:type IV secretory pathway TraG/TraD family ATPase VirD4
MINDKCFIFSAGMNLKLSLKQAYEGIHVFGATGSGKTSTLKTIVEYILKLGLGGIVLCDKPEEAQSWHNYVKTYNRSRDTLFLSEEKFNFLDYEATRKGGGDSENIVKMLLEVTGKSQAVSNDPFWENATAQLIRNTVDLLQMAGEKVSLKNINRVVQSAPKSKDDIEKSGGGWFEEIITEARKLDHYDCDIVLKYWFEEFAGLADRTRSIVVSSFTGITDKLSRGKIGQIFNTETTFDFDDLRNGKILVCDLSNKEYGETGRFCNILMKYMFQKMAERRHDDIKPAFIWADEAQSFISKNDTNFLQTARSSKIINVFITQNIHNYYAELGNNGRSLTNALLGNFQTKLFFQNGDNETNKYASDLLGKVLIKRFSESKSIGIGGNTTNSKNEVMDYAIQPDRFFILEKGGYDYKYNVGFIATNPNWHKIYGKRFYYLFYNQKTGKTRHRNREILSERGHVGYFIQSFFGWTVVTLATAIIILYLIKSYAGLWR